MASTSSRPQPRRPRMANAASLNSVPKASPSDPSTNEPIRDIQAEDEMFMKNKNFTMRAWSSMAKSDPKLPIDETTSDDDGDSSEPDFPISPRLKMKRASPKPVLKWKNPSAQAILAISDDEDDDGTDDPNDISQNARGGQTHGKRSKSRSITPPPPLPQHQLEGARLVIRQHLEVSREDNSLDIDDFDSDVGNISGLAPELATIQAATKKKGKASSNRIDDKAAPTIPIHVSWLHHPQEKYFSSRSWDFNVKKDESFAELIQQISEDIGGMTRYMGIVLLHNGKILFPSSTLRGLNIWSRAEFEACTKSTYEAIKASRSRTTDSLEISPNSKRARTSSPPTSIMLSSSPENKVESDGKVHDTFKLTVRSKSHNIPVVVRPTTKCGTVVSTFLQRAGLPASEKARLLVDGDALDPETLLEETELEDGDVVDVSGL